MTETRTIILASNGQYATMGRYSYPTAEELDRARQQLADKGLTAWLATMHGNPFAKRRPRFTAIELLNGAGDFSDAVAAYQHQG